MIELSVTDAMFFGVACGFGLDSGERSVATSRAIPQSIR